MFFGDFLIATLLFRSSANFSILAYPVIVLPDSIGVVKQTLNLRETLQVEALLYSREGGVHVNIK